MEIVGLRAPTKRLLEMQVPSVARLDAPASSRRNTPLALTPSLERARHDLIAFGAAAAKRHVIVIAYQTVPDETLDAMVQAMVDGDHCERHRLRVDERSQGPR